MITARTRSVAGGRVMPAAVEPPAAGMQWAGFPLIEHTTKRWADFLKGRTPILESIVPLDSRGLRDWKALGKDSLIAHARWRLADGKVIKRKELERMDSGLYQALRKRKLLDEAGLSEKYRDWTGMEKEELAAYSKKFIAENRIGRRKELEKADRGLYTALRKKKLLDDVGLPKGKAQRPDFAAMEDDELREIALGRIAEREIRGRREFRRAERDLYAVLRKRGLADGIGLKGVNRNWGSMDDEDIKAYAVKFISDNGIKQMRELAVADPSQCYILRRRGLLPELGLEYSPPKTKRRQWASMSNEELREHAERFISEAGIRSKSALENADVGLYNVLLKRGLTDEIGLENKKRGWAAMSNEGLSAFAGGYIREKGIRMRIELFREDGSLYYVLKKRGLLDAVGLVNKNKGHRNWAGMKDDEIVRLAKKFIDEHRIKGRHELEKADSRMYHALLRRNLLNETFSDSESSNHAEAVEGILDALESFGDEK